jgi:uncharacterized protein YbjQ (UPF0145 family)
MQCTSCDGQLPDDAQFCIYCGAVVAPAQTGPTQRLAAVPAATLDPSMVSSALTLPGFRIVRSLGIVRGLTVRSASVGGSIAAAVQSLAGGNIRAMTRVCEQARTEAFTMILEHAAQLGATGIIGFAYDTTEVAQGMTEVLAYGTAVIVEPDGDQE